MFLNVLKKKKATKFLTRHFAQPQPLAIDEVEKINTVACIVNLDEFEDISCFAELVEALGITPNQFCLIGYSEQTKTIRRNVCPLFSFKSLDYKMTVRDTYVSSFLKQEYDLLINYFSTQKIPLLYLSALTNAAIRVGFAPLDIKYNDIIFKLDMEDFSLFKRELINYLKILNKL